MTSLRRAAAHGAVWTSAASALSAAVQLVQLAFLTRWVAPEAFGLVAMAMVSIGLAQTVSDLGLSSALISRQDTTQEQRSSLYWLNVLMGATLTAMSLLAAPAIAALYGEPRVIPVLRLAAPIFLLVALGQQFQVLLERQLEFRRLAWIDASSTVTGCVVAVGLAARDPGPLALVSGTLAAAGLRAVLLAKSALGRWAPAFRLRRADLRGYVAFGLYQMGERAVNFLAQRLDQILIGRLAGAGPLGYYSFAYHLATVPLQRINPALTRVAFPVLSRVQDDPPRLRRGYLSLRHLLATLNVPLQLGLAAVAPLLVPGVFGERWRPAVPLVAILVWVGLLRSLGNPVGSLLLARRRADLGFRWNLLLAAIQGPALAAGALLGGAIGAALGSAAVQSVFALAEYPLLVRPLVGPCLGAYARTAWAALWTGVVMLILVAPLAWGAWLPWQALVALQVALGAATYVGLNLVFHGPETRGLLRELRG